MDLSVLKQCGIEYFLSPSLSKHTTFQLGGSCLALIQANSSKQMADIVKNLIKNDLPFIVLGSGSNVIISDKGLDCVVVQYVNENFNSDISSNEITVDAGVLLDELSLITIKKDFSNLVPFSGIPGTLGGAIVGNAGAWGQQVSDFVVSVTIIDSNGDIKELSVKDCNFSYRYSRFKESQEIILKAKLKLLPGDVDEAMAERNKILDERHKKHPDLTVNPCAGSFFKNIDLGGKRRQAAGYLLEESGAKKMSVGGAFVFKKHANIVIKGEKCTSQDVYDLSLRMAKAVKEKFDIDLIHEVYFIGEFR